MEIPFFACFASFAVKRVWPIANCHLLIAECFDSRSFAQFAASFFFDLRPSREICGDVLWLAAEYRLPIC
jgi:hypothetical protein